MRSIEGFALEGLAQRVLRDCGMETAESPEPATVLLGRHEGRLRQHRLGQEQRLHVGRRIGDVVAVATVAICPADPENCQRAVISYADGTRSMHSTGLPPGVDSLLEHMGVELTPVPCNHHGGEQIAAIREA